MGYNRHTYVPSTKENERRRKAVEKARNRGKVATEWFEDNELTSDTIDEFRRVMKKADKNFKK